LFVPILSRLFDAWGRPPESIPGPSSSRHMMAHSRCVSSSSKSSIADGFWVGTVEPSPQSQSFSQSYGSILLTSLASIIPLARSCSPWTPDAIMSMTRCGRYSTFQTFKGHRGRTRHRTTCGALPTVRRGVEALDLAHTDHACHLNKALYI
jgi:hypothetical protein